MADAPVTTAWIVRPSGHDPEALRALHARAFITRIRPASIAFAAVALLFVGPVSTADDVLMWIALGLTALTTLIGVVLIRRIDLVKAAIVVAWMDVFALTLFVAGSSTPDVDAVAYLLPIIAVAYFGRGRSTIALVLLVTAWTFFASKFDPDWQDAAAIPSATYVLLVSGVLLSFITRASRQVEESIAEEQSRDRAALETSQAMAHATDVDVALEMVAHSIASRTTARRVLVIHGSHQGGGQVELVASGPESASRELPRAQELLEILSETIAGGISVVVSRGAAAPDVHVLGPGTSTRLASLLDLLDDEMVTCVPIAAGPHHLAAIILEHESRTPAAAQDAQLALGTRQSLATELARLVAMRDQRAAFESLRTTMEFRDRLMASVSHELRTPLTTTIGSVETLLRTDVQLDEASRRSLMELARDAGHRLLHIVEDLLVISATRPDSPAMRLGDERLSTLFDDAVVTVPMPEERTLKIDVAHDGMLHVDRTRMLQLLTNLLVNAVRHGGNDIQLCGDIAHGFATVEVLDDGSGVPRQHVHELFLPFMHFGDREDSTGLGLALCRAVAEAHHGTIDYARTSDGLTRFRVRIPVA